MTKRKAAPKKGAKLETPLDAQLKALTEQANQLRAEKERCEKKIDILPKLAQERQRRRRDEFVTRAARTEQRVRPRAALPDPRYKLNADAPARQRRLRSERNEGRAMFFILLLVFGGVVAWLYLTVFHG
jgi:hypothetical protein